MAMLLYNYLHSNVHSVELEFNAFGVVIGTVPKSTPVWSLFGVTVDVFEAYITGAYRWAIDMRVPVHGYVNPANNSWYPIPLYGSWVVPTPNAINLVDRTHNVRLSWVETATGALSASNPENLLPTPSALGRIAVGNTGIIATSHTMTTTLAAIGLDEYTDEEVDCLDLIGRKIVITTRTDVRRNTEDVTYDLVGNIHPVDVDDVNITLNAARNQVTAMDLPYDPLKDGKGRADISEVLRTDSFYIFNTARVNGTDVSYSGNTLRSATAPEATVASGTSSFGVDTTNLANTTNSHMVLGGNLNRDGKNYSMYLIHNGYFGAANQVDITQEFFYVLRPHHVGVRVADHGGNTRFTTHVAGADTAEGVAANFTRTGVPWADLIPGADFDAAYLAAAESIEHAFFYEIRGGEHNNTIDLYVHGRLLYTDSGELVGGIDNTLFFAGGNPSAATFNQYIAIGSWLGGWVGEQGIAGTANATIGVLQEGRRYRLFSTTDANPIYALARETFAPAGPTPEFSKYRVVVGNPSTWSIPLVNEATGNYVGAALFVEVFNPYENINEQILIGSINSSTSTLNNVVKGDRIRLVSQSNRAWNVVIEPSTGTDWLLNAGNAPGANYDPSIPAGAENRHRFAQTTTANSITQTAAGALEYTFGNNGTLGGDFLTVQGVTSISRTVAVRDNPVSGVAGNSNQRAIITNDTRVIIWSSHATEGGAALTMGPRVGVAQFLEAFLDSNGGTHASDLRVVAERPVAGNDNVITSAGAARYIFIDTTLPRSAIMMTSPIEHYGLVSVHHSHWFVAPDADDGSTDIIWRRGQIKSYAADGTPVDLEVCWPEALTDTTFALGAFAARTSETRIDNNGVARNVLRFIDGMVQVGSDLDDAVSIPNLTEDPTVSTRVATVTNYLPGNILVLDNHDAIDLTGMTTFNRIRRESDVTEIRFQTGTAGATATPTSTMAEPNGRLWFAGLGTLAQFHDWLAGILTADRELWAVIYQSNLGNKQILAITIIEDWVGYTPPTPPPPPTNLTAFAFPGTPATATAGTTAWTPTGVTTTPPGYAARIVYTVTASTAAGVSVGDVLPGGTFTATGEGSVTIRATIPLGGPQTTVIAPIDRTITVNAAPLVAAIPAGTYTIANTLTDEGDILVDVMGNIAYRTATGNVTVTENTGDIAAIIDALSAGDTITIAGGRAAGAVAILGNAGTINVTNIFDDMNVIVVSNHASAGAVTVNSTANVTVRAAAGQTHPVASLTLTAGNVQLATNVAGAVDYAAGSLTFGGAAAQPFEFGSLVLRDDLTLSLAGTRTLTVSGTTTVVGSTDGAELTLEGNGAGLIALVGAIGGAGANNNVDLVVNRTGNAATVRFGPASGAGAVAIFGAITLDAGILTNLATGSAVITGDVELNGGRLVLTDATSIAGDVTVNGVGADDAPHTLLVISGGGTVVIDGGVVTQAGNITADVEIRDGTVLALGALQGDHDLTISGGTVEAFAGINASGTGTLLISGGTVALANGTGTTVPVGGLHVSGGDITLAAGAVTRAITLTGNDATIDISALAGTQALALTVTHSPAKTFSAEIIGTGAFYELGTGWTGTTNLVAGATGQLRNAMNTLIGYNFALVVGAGSTASVDFTDMPDPFEFYITGSSFDVTITSPAATNNAVLTITRLAP
jgi:hypothetical protein